MTNEQLSLKKSGDTEDDQFGQYMYLKIDFNV